MGGGEIKNGDDRCATMIAALVVGAAEAFGKVLPPQCELRPDDDRLVLTSPVSLEVFFLGENIRHRLDAQFEPLAAVQNAVLSLARQLQDSVTEIVTFPWPKDPSLLKSDFALPDAQIRDGVVVVWFGREEDSLTPPIRIPLPPNLIDAPN